ncbi:MAG TPA: hypothetical protein V6D05_01420 [Stenomitos sp.]
MKFAPMLVALVMASSVLAGCGATPGATTGIKSAQTTDAVEGQDFWSVSRAKKIATDALGQYDRLRDRWLRAYTDAEKDRIEDDMLVILSRGIADVRDSVSAEQGGTGYNARQVFDLADRACQRYEDLRDQWAHTNNLDRQREISNQMQTLIVDALNQVKRVSRFGN